MTGGIWEIIAPKTNVAIFFFENEGHARINPYTCLWIEKLTDVSGQDCFIVSFSIIQHKAK